MAVYFIEIFQVFNKTVESRLIINGICTFVLSGFIIQTGDPTNTGKGGKSIWGGNFEDEFDERLKHYKRGIVSMANKGPNQNGSQFFITLAKQPNLDMKYTIIGHVIDGFDTLEELEKLPINEKTYRPEYDVKIKEVEIHSNPIADLAEL